MYGVDFNFLWEPTHRMRYRNLEWRTEFYFLDRDILAPDGSGQRHDRRLGCLHLSAVEDRPEADSGPDSTTTPDAKDYADLDSWLAPHAVRMTSPSGRERPTSPGSRAPGYGGASNTTTWILETLPPPITGWSSSSSSPPGHTSTSATDRERAT